MAQGSGPRPDSAQALSPVPAQAQRRRSGFRVERIFDPARPAARRAFFERAQSVLCLLLPPAFFLWLYSRSFRIWFREDDFPLLQFVREPNSWREFLAMLYMPYAQGTIRPLSERLPFLISWNLFGENCVPFRIFVYLTGAADLCLLAWITRRLTGSRLAGVAAAMFWAASAALITPMTWNSGYNEVQYELFLLGALALFIRYGDTGERRFWWWQLAVFVAGFGSLENNIVYPAIAVAWALLVAEHSKRKRLLLSTIPLFAISAAYYALHMKIAPAPASGIYAIRIDRRIWSTFWEYWRWAFLAPEAFTFGLTRAAGKRILLLTMASFTAFIVWQLRKRRTAILFGPAWFLLVLGPMLLLPDRHTEYYLCGPVMGLAMAAGWGVALAWRQGWMWRGLALVPALAWAGAMLPAARGATGAYAAQSRTARFLVVGTEQARRRHPGKTILLEGVSQDAYQAVIFESGFRAFGMENVYLTPEARKTIARDPSDEGFDSKVADASVVRRALDSGEAVVFDFSPGHLRNVTADYHRYAALHFPNATPRRIDAANPLYAYLLGPGWEETQGFVRWMGGRASFRIAGPGAPGTRLRLAGYCWDRQLQSGPIHLSASADGIDLGVTELRGPETRFETGFPLPDALIGRPDMEVVLRAWPTARADGQDRGVMVEWVAIQ